MTPLKMKSRFKRVLLINPAYNKVSYAPLIFAGLGYVAESLL